MLKYLKILTFSTLLLVFGVAHPTQSKAEDAADNMSAALQAGMIRGVEAAGELYFAYWADQFDLLSRGQSSIFGKANAIRNAAQRVEIQSFASRKANELAQLSQAAKNSNLSIADTAKILSIIGYLVEGGVDSAGTFIELNSMNERYPELNLDPSILQVGFDSAKNVFVNTITGGGILQGAYDPEHDIYPNNWRDQKRWLSDMDSAWFDILSDPSNPLYAEIFSDFESGEAQPPAGLMQYLKIYRDAEVAILRDMGIDANNSRMEWIDAWDVTFIDGQYYPDISYVRGTGVPVTDPMDWEASLCRGQDCSNIWDTSNIGSGDEDASEDDDNTETANPVVSTDDNTRDNELVVTENDNGEPVLGNNAGTNIEIPTEPTGPTPEEIAEAERLAEEERLAAIAEAERLAALRLQQIADLEAARDSLSLTQQDAQARLQERRNRLTVLQFNELEKVTEASGLVSGRIQELRTEQGATGLSASDQQLLLDLVAYEDRLQTEQDRIARDITAAQNSITQYETTLAQVETQLNTNAASLEGPDYSIASDYTVPNFTPEGLTDWTTYEYELPVFDPTETPATTTQLGFIAAAKASPTSNFLLTHGANATITDDGSAATTLSSANGSLMVTASNPATGNYQHLSWGTFSGPVSFTDSGTGQTHSLENVRWLHGDTTPASYFLNKTGSASWTGNVYGDYALNGTDQTFYNAVTGDVGFTVNFSDNSVAGTLATNTNYAPSVSTSVSSSSNFTLSGNFMTGDIEGISGAGINTQVLSFGNSVGGLNGAFFGPSAEEFGGTFWYRDSDGGASGIVVAKEGTITPPSGTDYSNFRGLVAYTYSAASTNYDPALDFASVESVSATGEMSFAGTPKTLVVSETGYEPGDAYDSNGTRYDYVSWGPWRNSNVYINDVSKNGEDRSVHGTAGWIIYDPTTDLPNQGTASYSGELGHVNIVTGPGNSYLDPGGTINLNADFANDQVTGSMVVGSNGNTWGSANFDAAIRRDTGSSGFQGALSGADVNSGVIFGGFAGPNAEEVGGGFQFDHVNGSSANGIFRAKQ